MQFARTILHPEKSKICVEMVTAQGKCHLLHSSRWRMNAFIVLD